jgi:ribonucleoside-diphosphate reductase alpha subunit
MLNSINNFKSYINELLIKIKVRTSENLIEINVDTFCNEVFTMIIDDMIDDDIVKIAMDCAYSRTTYEPDYEYLASTLAWDLHHKIIKQNIAKHHPVDIKYNPNCIDPIDVLSCLYYNINQYNNNHDPRIKKQVYDFALRHQNTIREMINYDNDMNLSYFSYNTLNKSYFQRIRNDVIESAQNLFLRVALGIHYANNDIESVKTTYYSLSNKYYTHATPTLFNASTSNAQNSSCFLLYMPDSMEGIYDTLKKCALISKQAGGIGINISSVRAKGTLIKGTGGTSNGIIPMLKPYNDTARYADQCFTPETLVFTLSDFRQIQKINVGDYLLTDKRNYCKVEKVLKNYYKGPILKIGIKNINKIQENKNIGDKIDVNKKSLFAVTPEHQILCHRKTNSKTTKPCMVDAKVLLVGDYVCYPYIFELYYVLKYILEPDQYFIDFDMICVKIDSIEQISYTGQVYDFEVEQDHTYVTNIGTCHNGGGKRKGSFAIYLEPWHAEIMEFLELRLNHGNEDNRARDLFTAMWIPDLFMERVERDEMWSLFCPCKFREKYGIGLQDVYGDEFNKLYIQGEIDIMYNEQIPARKVYRAIITSQLESGLPYMMYKDSVNEKNNQKNIGIIRGSNLCTEIVEYTDENNISVCNLASLSLPAYIINKKRDLTTRFDIRSSVRDGIPIVNESTIEFDFILLGKKVSELVINLNRIIDVNDYPVDAAKQTNFSHRPIGIGVQGLADVFAIFKYSWDSNEAKILNRQIFETIYYYATKTSANLGIKQGSYPRYSGSPISSGILQCDMWNVKPIMKYNWSKLRQLVKRGMRNSLLIAPMPTASTAQILGNNESVEPYTYIISSRKVLSGEFYVIVKHLVNTLKQLKLWNKDLVDEIILGKGSIQNIMRIPEDIRDLYRTAWELSAKTIMDLAADRSPFIDQSHSLNAFIARPTIAKLSTYHMYGWKKGLKTGMYYLRTQSARSAIQFTIKRKIKEIESTDKQISSIKSKKKYICTDDICIMCSS